jgi:hypothetical protein
MTARAETARFILEEALRLGIKVGTDGDELAMLAPMRIPRESRLTFEQALQDYRAEIIAHIIAENRERT